MKEINLPSGDYLFVECDQDSHSHSLTKFKTHAVIDYKRTLTGDSKWSDNIGGLNTKLLDYKIISTTKNITEEQAESIVTKVFCKCRYGSFMSSSHPCKKEYKHPKTARESLQSLIQTNGLDVNKNHLILKKI